jgi:hypothetical protein
MVWVKAIVIKCVWASGGVVVGDVDVDDREGEDIGHIELDGKEGVRMWVV